MDYSKLIEVVKNLFPGSSDQEIIDAVNDMFTGYTREYFNGKNASPEDMAHYMSILSDECTKDIAGSDTQEQFEDDVADAYGKFAKNFAYTYKPEATEIDPSIDPEEQHIGIMAQDIEKINPACIKETEEGVKTVDTGRLTLMNAGAIGDLARRLKALEEKIV